MSVGAALRWLFRALAVVVLLGSALYLTVYLYRWEWNRALISGIFLVAALVALTSSIVLGSLRRIQDRLDALESRDHDVGADAAAARSTGRAVTDANRAEPAARFRWLRGDDRLSVFIPILLGAGVLLSAAAFVVERLAGLVAGATVDRRTGMLLAPDLPLGPTSATGPVQLSAGRRRGIAVLSAVAVLGVGAVTVLVLRGVTMARSEPTDPDAVTTLTVEAHHRDDVDPPVEVVRALWVVCRGQIPERAELVSARPAGADRVELVVAPGIGPVGRRRLSGCLEDVVVDRVDADVIDARTVGR